MWNDLLSRLGMGPVESGVHGASRLDHPSGPEQVSINPATGETLGRVLSASVAEYPAKSIAVRMTCS